MLCALCPPCTAPHPRDALSALLVQLVRHALPTQSTSSVAPLTDVPTHTTAQLQIWGPPIQGAGRSDPDTLEVMNSWLKQHGVLPPTISIMRGSGWLTVSGVRLSKNEGSPRRILAAPTSRASPRGKFHSSPHDQLRAPSGAIRTHAKCRPDDVLWLAAHPAVHIV